MKICVTYYSETGNTEKIANEIFQGIESEDKDMAKLDGISPEKLMESELAFIGFPVQAGGLPRSVKSFMKEIPSINKVAIFCTHASPKEMKMVDGALNASEKILKGKDAEIIGIFDSPGEIKVDNLLKIPMIKQSEEFWKGHPDDEDLKNARDFGKEMSSKI
ncbi:MAG: flavodoxin family protein [Halobacteriota archaeon]|nr:flavodoxin family protein [Halobacteriota archaeon]